MEYFSVKGWEKFQHYKDRNPPWIKLHKEVIDDYDISCLQDASRLLQMLLWVLASQMNNRIPNDPDWIQKRLSLRSKVVLKELFDKGFLILEQNASDMLASCKQDARPETYREETEKEKEKDPSIFILPEWIPKDLWDALLQIRKKKKAADTIFAKNLIIKDLAKFREQGFNIIEIIEYSIKGGYPSVYEPKYKTKIVEQSSPSRITL